MIAALKGRVINKTADGIVVDVGGVGYYVHVPLSSLYNIPDGEVFLYTHTHVREDALQLYGFLTEEEKKVFVTLLGVNGIGPKLGLAVLSGMPVQRFMEAVYNEDIQAITSIPGLGKKTAARLILELKEKLPKITAYSTGAIASDAVSALVNLGYKKSLADEVVERAIKKGANTIEDIIRDALKFLTGSE